MSEPHVPRPQRPSASADASHEAERTRLRAMSPRERVLLALRAGLLGERLSRGVRIERA